MSDTPSGAGIEPAGSGSEEHPGPGELIERFTATGGRVLGVIVLGIGVLGLADILLEWRTRGGITAAAVIVMLGAGVWMTMVRPVVEVRERALVIKNVIRDAMIPWHRFTSVETTPILTVADEDGKLHRSAAIAAGRADRRASRVAQRQARSAANPEVPGSAPRVSDASRAIRPTDHIMSRVRTAASDNKEKSKAVPQVERRWAVPELAVLALGALVFILNNWIL